MRGYKSDDAHNTGEDVLIRFHYKKTETAAAYLLYLTVDDAQGVWLPKSQVTHIDLESKEVWIPLWLAEKKGLEYH